MAGYVDYTYYTQVYQGFEIPESRFGYWAAKASAYLDQATFGRTAEEETPSDAVQLACCAVAEAYYLNRQGGGVASEKAGDYSVNYVAGVSKAKTEDERLYEAAALYLADSGLLYRGVEP